MVDLSLPSPTKSPARKKLVVESCILLYQMYIQPNVRMGRSVLVLQAKTAVGRVRLGRFRPPDRGGLDPLERVEPLELDVLLTEVCLMHTRAEMYWRFVRLRSR